MHKPWRALGCDCLLFKSFIPNPKKLLECRHLQNSFRAKHHQIDVSKVGQKCFESEKVRAGTPCQGCCYLPVFDSRGWGDEQHSKWPRFNSRCSSSTWMQCLGTTHSHHSIFSGPAEIQENPGGWLCSEECLYKQPEGTSLEVLCAVFQCCCTAGHKCLKKFDGQWTFPLFCVNNGCIHNT